MPDPISYTSDFKLPDMRGWYLVPPKVILLLYACMFVAGILLLTLAWRLSVIPDEKPPVNAHLYKTCAKRTADVASALDPRFYGEGQFENLWNKCLEE